MANSRKLTDDDLKEMRTLIIHESNMTNSRLFMITTLNGLLLTALGLITDSSNNFINYKPIAIDFICGLGIVITFVISISIISADNAINKILKIYKNSNRKEEEDIPIIGMRLKRIPGIIMWLSIPIIFTIIWLLILFKLN